MPDENQDPKEMHECPVCHLVHEYDPDTGKGKLYGEKSKREGQQNNEKKS